MHPTKTVGDIGELFIAATLLEKGFLVSKPMLDHAPYDLILDTGAKLLKIQVKSRSIDKGAVTVQNETTAKRYKQGDFDIIAVYCIDTKEVAFINWKDISDKRTMALRIDKSKNNQLKNVKMFSDYTLESSLS